MQALHCLKLYLERLGYTFKPDGSCEDQESIADLLELTSRAAMDKEFLNCRPTITAAAILYCDRLHKGLLPFWPSSLATLTGYSNARTAELAAAISGAQRLCKLHLQPKRAGPALGMTLQKGPELINAAHATGEESRRQYLAATAAVAPTAVSVMTAQSYPSLQLLLQQQQEEEELIPSAAAEAPASAGKEQANPTAPAAHTALAAEDGAVSDATTQLAEVNLSEATIL